MTASTGIRGTTCSRPSQKRTANPCQGPPFKIRRNTARTAVISGNGTAGGDTAPTTAASQAGRIRDLQIALRAAKISMAHQIIVTHLATHCDSDGATWVSLRRLAKNLGYAHRSSVWVAIEAARVAGFVERVTGGDRDLWIIPLMRAPGRAHLSPQVRADSEEVRASGRAQGARAWTRAPSEVPVSNRRSAKNVVHSSEERTPETIAAIHDLRRQLRRRA